MSLNPKHDRVAVEPLTGEYSPELVDLDSLLTEQASQTPVPLGLSQRVFAASVAHLPAESYKFAHHAAPHAAKRLQAGRARWFKGVSGQVAMAASVALAFGVALWFVQEVEQSNVAQSDIEGELILAQAFRPDGSAFAIEGQFDYLLDTNELTSPEVITDELTWMVSELAHEIEM